MTSLAQQDAAARWRQAALARRQAVLAGGAVFLAAIILAAHVGEVDLRRLAAGLPMAADYIWRTIPVLRLDTLGDDLAEWMWGFGHWLRLLGDTLLVAYGGTVLGGLAALALSFPAAATFAPRWAVVPARRLLELARTVPVLVLALIFVYAFGLGPFAGMLAIAVHSAGALGKLFAEEHENAQHGPVEGIRSAGGSWMQQMRYGVLPQSMPGVLSYGLLRFEINVREASVLGIVGAGGIGVILHEVIRGFDYAETAAVLIIIIISVTLLDLASARIRQWAI